jgi:hypothetical protein
MKNWGDYFDSNNLLTQEGPSFDGGDTPSHEGLARTLNSGTSDPVIYPTKLTDGDVAKLLILPNGLLIRNPIHYNNPTDPSYGTSRDQYRSLIAAFSTSPDYANGYLPRAIETLWNGLPRNFLGIRYYPNGDFYSPEDRTIFTRWTQSYIGRVIGDFCTFLNSMLICFWITRIYGQSYTSNDIDHIAVCLLGAKVRPTFMNRLARWIYGKFRPGGVQYALDEYFSDDEDPPVNTLGPNVIPRYFP